MTVAFFWHAVLVYALITLASLFGALIAYGLFCTPAGRWMLLSLFGIAIFLYGAYH